jgi:C-terminal processing protease CtpA/Prc
MLIMKDRIKELLGAGLLPSVVSSAVGCSESYVSQLLSQESFAAEVQELRLLALTAQKERDANYDTLEDKLLARLGDTIDTLVRPREIASILQTVNNAKRRSHPAELGATAATTIVNLSLPNIVAAKFTVNGANQVMEIEGRSIATMPAKAVLDMISPVGKLPNKETEQLDIERARERLAALKPLEFIPFAEQL